MVRRALKGDIERDFHPVVFCAGDEALEVRQRAELRIDRLVPALLRADGPRAPGIALVRRERVILALAVRAADRMDRRQVEHIEYHRCDTRQAQLQSAEGAVCVGTVRERAGEKLVPGAEARPLPIDRHRELLLVARSEAAVGIFFYEANELRIDACLVFFPGLSTKQRSA